VTIRVVSRKALWGRSGNRCAFPTCRIELIQAEDEITRAQLSGAGLIVGEEAHIRGQNPDSARYDSAYEQVDEYVNLILLCPTHHTVIDKDEPQNWPVERVEKLKRDHEDWVRASLSPGDANSVETQILVAADVQRIEDLIFAIWPDAYWQLSRPVPALRLEYFDAIVDVGRLLLAKDWPQAYPIISAAAERLRHLISILADHLAQTFEPPEESGTSARLVRKEKRLQQWDTKLYNELFHQTQIDMVATWWLADTLTLELNQWIRAVREELDRHYRYAEGVILVRTGDGIVEPLGYARLDYGTRAVLPVLPRSRFEIRDCVEAVAAQRKVEPQRVHPSELSFPFPGDGSTPDGAQARAILEDDGGV